MDGEVEKRRMDWGKRKEVKLVDADAPSAAERYSRSTMLGKQQRWGD